MKDRYYSFLIPGSMDAARAFVQTAVPLLAMRYGASIAVLATIGAIAQALRLPMCFASGHVSEKVGRTRVIVPAALVMTAAAIGLTFVSKQYQVTICFVLAIGSLGAFYPPLQALIGDVSKRGELTKNLGAFNIGWCACSAAAAFFAPYLIERSLSDVLYLAAALSLVAPLLVLVWRRQPAAKRQQEQTIPATEYPDHLLLIARMGHFLGFFGWGIIAMLFPRLGRSLGWSDPAIAYVIAFLMIGQSAGILLANASPWWRGKLWPQFAAQGLMLLCAIVISITSDPVVFESAFVVLGIVISVAYTAALYHGMSARKALGKNTGIHESLIAAGNISGCLIGGIAARMTHSLRAPYVAFACMAGACVVIAIVISCKTLIRRS